MLQLHATTVLLHSNYLTYTSQRRSNKTVVSRRRVSLYGHVFHYLLVLPTILLGAARQTLRHTTRLCFL